MMKYKNIIRVVALALVLSLGIGGVLYHNNFSVKADSDVEQDTEEDTQGFEISLQIDEQEVESCEIIEETDDMIKIVSRKVDGSFCVTTTTDDEVKKEYYLNDGRLVYEECVANDEETAEMLVGLENEEDLYLPDDVDELYKDERQTDITSGHYDKSTKKLTGTVCEVFNRKHWYNMCKLSGKKVLFIGCDASYRIEYDKLSKEKKIVCSNYIDGIKASNEAVIVTLTGVAVAMGAVLKEVLPKLLPIISNAMDMSAQGLPAKEVYEYVKKQLTKKFGKAIAGKFAKALTAGGLYDLTCRVLTGKSFLATRKQLKSSYRTIRKYGKKVDVSHTSLTHELMEIGLGHYNPGVA